MSKETTEETELRKESSAKLLEQIKGLLILQLRQAKVDDTAIGNIIGLKGKSVRNRYPLTKKESEEATNPPPDASSPDTSTQ